VRGAHQALEALEALRRGLMELGGGWVIDLEIEDFFGSVDFGSSEELSGPTGARRGDARSDREVAECRSDGGGRVELSAAVPPEGGDPVRPAEVYVHGKAVGLPKWQGWAKAAREKLNAVIEDAHFPSAAEPAEVAA